MPATAWQTTMTIAPTEPAPIIPDRDPTHTPVIPERDPTHTPVLPDVDPTREPDDQPVSPLDVAGLDVDGLAFALDRALDVGSDRALWALADVEPVDERDELLALATVHELFLGSIDGQRHRIRFQHHPAVAALKGRLEAAFLDRVAGPAGEYFDRLSLEHDELRLIEGAGADATVGVLRAIAAREQVPEVYDWLATSADEDQTRWYLSLEGGPDGTFDDLVALCQVGLGGEPKLELAVNYWDEMGTGDPDLVHTELHEVARRALGLWDFAPTDLPVEALRRSVLVTTLATNRSLQPELVGALGLTELQAGPRCRKVVAALERLGSPPEAVPFYAEHAVADPRHGKDWLDHVAAPLARDQWWAEGMVRGARWRWCTNRSFFEAAQRLCAS